MTTKMKIIMNSITGCLTAAILMLALPFNGRAQNATVGEVVVKGRIGNINPPAQLWIYMGEEQWDMVSIRDGKFEYRKQTKLPAYGAMMVRYKPYIDGDERSGSFFSHMSLLSLFFEEGVIAVNSPVDTLSKKYAKVTGSSIQDKYMAYWAKEGEIVRAQRALAAIVNQASPEQLQSESFLADYEQKNEQLLRRWDSLFTQEIRNYPASLHTYIAFDSYRRQREPDDASTLALAQLFAGGYRDRAITVVEDAIRAKKKSQISFNVGDEFPVFELHDPSGNPVKLTDFRGNYVLVDFWASWCVPCRKVNPELVKLHQKYRGTSFEIVGVSFDTDSAAWKEAIHADRLDWVHVSDLGGVDGKVGDTYGVTYIPQNYLIDPKGRIIAKNLQMDELDEQLEKL